MSKSRNNVPRAAIHVGAPAKSFSAAEGNEPERRGWDENTYRLKNQDTNNHYDFSRKHLNFEINSQGEIVPLGSNPVPLHERLQKRLDELEFKPYMDKNNPLGISDNSPNCTVGIIVSGDHDVLTRLAFGDQNVDFTLQKSNAHVMLKQGIKDWALDTYRWACDRWGAENIIGFDVHLDETTPHIQIQTIPVAKTKARGRASAKYVHKDDKSKVFSYKEWKKQPEEIRLNFIRTEDERREKECVSYASVWGKDKYAVGKTYYQMHTDYYNEVGHKYGLERGDDIAMLPGEERRERIHKSKAVLEAERQAKDAIARNQMENERLEGQKEKMVGEVQDMKKQKECLEEQNDKLEGEIHYKEHRKEKLEGNISLLEDYAAALDIKEEDLIVPTLKTDPLVKNAWDDIKEELAKPIPTFGHKEWKEERRQAIKTILTELQTALMEAKKAHNEDIRKMGKSLYHKAMQNASAIIEQNKQLLKENDRLTEENDVLRKRIASMDENAITRLRVKKEAEIKELQERLGKAESEAVSSSNIASRERERADKAEFQIKEMLAIPEIKKIWETIQQNKRNFNRQLNQWIDNALKAIAHFAAYEKNVHFSEQQCSAISMGIIANAFKSGLDVTDNTARLQATQSLLDEVDWSETSDYKQGLTRHWTEMFSQDMTISQTLMETLTLAAGGRGGISTGGGGSNGELTNWDGTKKKTGWGMS
ncbi:MobV family relaxase [Bacteroides heparinolyticus]|uniref:MobV family relaxase n=1 Tax=Prevotella heparinolytica TaxID=28113 RepID=UPI0023F75FDD|nr:MobV family relaxase [Bacteroides heparinolyticus]MCI6211940.1 plasmid recombination protein [Bacteroides heparinolyticus]